MGSMNYEAKHDEGKPDMTNVDTMTIYDISKIKDYDQDVIDGIRAELIRKTEKKNGSWYGMFRCPFCGKEFESSISNAMRGKVKSCGCAKGKLMIRSNGTHGDTKARLYRIYRHILERCNDPNCKEYKWYGARGIRCEFDTYEEFREFALSHGYQDHLTVERINVDGNYSKDNITFIPLALQMRNTTRSVQITYKGLTLCAAEWAEILGFNPNTLTKRKRNGWSDERTLETVVGDAVDISLIPIEAIRAIRETRLYGIQKYKDPENWRSVDIQRYRAALVRHTMSYFDDPQGVDEESGLPHLWHAITNLAFICELERNKL